MLKKIIALTLCVVTLGLAVPVASADGGGGDLTCRVGGPIFPWCGSNG